MNAIIIEDEKLSAEHLTNLLNRIDATIHVIATFDSIKTSVTAFENGLIADVLFVDIHLADGLSFDIFSKVNITTPIIFTTAYDEYAIKAFKVNSIDYLLKPIGSNELSVAIAKLKQQCFDKLSNRDKLTFTDNITNAYNTITKTYKNRFMVKMGDTITSVKTEDVLHFIAEDGITLMATEGKRYAVDYTLDQLEGLIAPDLFFRINRKVVININAIQKVSTYFNSRLKIQTSLLLDDAAIVSRERVNEFKAWLDR
jgi:DNA-binding LytR/AlgR family response regulator